MGRRVAREIAMKLLYQLDIQINDREEQIRYCLDDNDVKEKDRVFIESVINGVCDKSEILDGKISENSKAWNIERISKIDLAIMRLSLYEIMFREDIPTNVSINEAVELAKKFSTDEAPAFINGIIGSICRSIDNR